MRIARLICSLLLVTGLLAIPVQSRAQVAVGISVRIGPPVLPVYVQPICPGPGYIWIPGYWAYGPYGYFWVPGTWVLAPEVGLLWTPGYWAFEDGFYAWYPGYWATEVGYYGGINYGFGYTGVGFFGGYWSGSTYYYNRAVTNVNVTVVRNTYNTTVINNTTINRVSYSGDPGGTTARPTSAELAVARGHHTPMTSMQTQHEQAASTDRTLLASENHGRPEVAAVARPGEFKGRGGAGKGANPNRPPEKLKEPDRPESPPTSGRRTHEDRPPSLRPSNAEPVNPAAEQKQQREIEKLRQKQDAERQKAERRNIQEQQKLDRKRSNEQQQEQLQRRQQQQMEQMNRKHNEQAQKLQERQQREAQKQPKQKESRNEKKAPKSDRPPEHQ